MKSDRIQPHMLFVKRVACGVLSALLLTFSGCCKDRTPTLDSIATAYVRVALELGERDPDSLDFAVVTPDVREAIHQSYPSYDMIDRETSQLLRQLQSTPRTNEQQSRAQVLTWQLQAIHARIAMLQGHPLDFASEARILFQTERLPDHQQQARALLRTRIAVMLPSSPKGSSSPAEAYSAYTMRFLIPPDRLRRVMTAALESCRQQTLSHLDLPASESVTLIFVYNKPWSAFSRFEGNAHSTLEINASFPLTVDQALELACHEGYPGHHVFNTLRDIALAQKKHLPEAKVQPTFSPQSYISESAAAYAPRLAFSDEERIRIERDNLFPLAGLSPAEAERYVTICGLIRELDSAEPTIAQRYLDGELEFVRALHALQTEMLMEHGEATLLYLNEYRSYMLAYTDGPRRIAAQLRHAANTKPSAVQDRDSAWRYYAELTGEILIKLPDPPAANRLERP